MAKILSVAFVWHMHQPLYKDHLTGKYLMPWVRLHAIKDYLDMVLILKNFPKIRQTFNLVPSLIEQLDDYAFNNANDYHSELTCKPTSELTDDDKVFILERFFDANYKNMIAPNSYYLSLYNRSKSLPANANINNFSEQEYADIMAWFNMVWFDPMWRNETPFLNELYKQQKDFTLEQRKKIIEIQRDIIKLIIPVYKEYQDRGQIEVTTTPYYHPILPLLINTDSAKISRPNVNLPAERFNHPEDAIEQLRKGVENYKEKFGRAPRGIWPSEQSVSPETIKLIANAGFKWAISDEGILASTLGKEFHRNFYGNLEDPRDLCQPYTVNIDDKKIDMIFRNIIYSDLIGFHFGKMDSSQAAWELYDRIKDIQQKLVNSTDQYLLTIALDGENCWEYFPNDGINFLTNLYRNLSEDNSLDITTVSEYLEKHPPNKILYTLSSGSWINRDFHIWIGDPAKNTGWNYLKKTRDDLVRITTNKHFDEETIKKAWEELYIAEGSDWFWWYGDPNVSAQDDLFDEQFRLHLQNVYRVLNEPIPSELFVPVEVFLGRSFKYPSSEFTPKLEGKLEKIDEWRQAGCLDLSSGAIYQSGKILRRVWFGFDKNHLNIRLDTLQALNRREYEIYIYAYNPNKQRANSNVMIRTPADNCPETFKYRYAYELHIYSCNGHGELKFSEAINDGLWKVKEKTKTKMAVGSVVELSIPFEELNVNQGEDINFVVVISKSNILHEIAPEVDTLSVKRD